MTSVSFLSAYNPFLWYFPSLFHRSEADRERERDRGTMKKASFFLEEIGGIKEEVGIGKKVKPSPS